MQKLLRSIQWDFPPQLPPPLFRGCVYPQFSLCFLFFFRLKCCEELLSHTERASPVLSRVAWIWLNPSLFNQAPLDGELFGRSQSSSVTAIAAINGECGVFVTCKAIWRMSSQKWCSWASVCAAPEGPCQLLPQRRVSQRHHHQRVRAFLVLQSFLTFRQSDTWKMVFYNALL